MGNEWVERNVEEVANVFGGGTPSTKDEANFNGEIPWITPKDLSGYPFRYISRGERNISKKGLNCSNAKLLPVGTVLLTTRAPVGYVAIAANPVTTNQGFHSLVPHNGYSSEFIYYLLKANAEYLKSNASGTTFGELSGSTLKRLKFVFPSIPEQRAIAVVLGSLDDKIELNHHINATLESMARAVFKAWFVENEEAKGWKVSSLGELFPGDKQCVLTGPFGSHLHAHDYRSEGTPLILVKHVMDGKIIEDNLPLVGDHKLPEMRRYQLKTGDIVFTRVGAVGRTAYIHPRYEGWLISGQTLRMRVSDTSKLNPRFLAQVYLEQSFIDMVEGFALGTTRPSLNTSILQSFKFVVPPIEIQGKFAEIVLSFDNKIQSNTAENHTLAALRDALLPRLMSGDVRVKDVGLIAGEKS